MGAGGSTAASCSSLDLANGANGRHYYRQNRYHQHMHEQRLQKLRKQRKVPLDGKSGPLKQSASYFDLTTSHLIDHHASANHQPDQRALSPSRHWKQNASNGINGDHMSQQGESYSLSNANIGARRPVMVLPCKPAISPALHSKKTNAGVASRILHQRQQQRFIELKKFSDSLPSLNNLAPQLGELPMGQIDRDLSRLRSPTNHHHHHHLNKHNLVASNEMGGSNSPQFHTTSDQQQITLATHQSHHLLHNYNNNEKTNHHLVSKNNNNDAFYHNQNHKHHQRQQQQLSWQIAKQIEKNHMKPAQVSTRQLMKRATSLSSLHNSNHHHHHHHHQANQLHEQHHLDVVNCSRTPYAPRGSSNNNNNNNGNIMNSKLSLHQLNKPPALRPESMNSNCSPSAANSCDLHKQPCNQRHSSHLRSSPLDNYHHHQHHHQQQPPQLQYNQPPALVKKVLKYKQAPNNGGGQSSKQNKYKSKQQHQLLQQPPTPPQQGCPVLPPLPRSQSLHELIQLRATENGQRMRTTGTLRGPLNGADQGNKVNLVAELLESRRQQKQQVNDQQGPENGATLLSQSSSTDDGIHDVSITGDNNSTGDSRHTTTNHPSSNASRTPTSSSNTRRHDDHELTTRVSAPSMQLEAKQSVFKKQVPMWKDANRSRRYSQDISNGNNSVDRNDGKTNNSAAKLKSQGLIESRHLKNHHHHDQQHQYQQQQQQQQQKSTLKRSLSHSALHQQSNYDRSSDQDGDESEDLNELAMFLYQFKKLQANKNGANAHPSDISVQETRPTSKTKQVSLSPSSSSSSSSSAAAASQTDQASPNLQQSPNSTTSSSSGFASSTCTSQSTTSSDELRGRGGSSSPSRPSRTDGVCSPAKKLNARKKYPAPPRPDERQSSGETNKTATTTTSTTTTTTTTSSGKKTKCPISGKLKLSSSLLSIVDEYQSTLQSNYDSLSPVALMSSATNLTSVLMGSNNCNNNDERPELTSSTPAGLTTAPGSSGPTTPLPVKSDLSRRKSNQVSRAPGNDGESSHNQQHLLQLEQLKRYTQLRQMSQSELALNHLTASTALTGQPDGGRHQLSTSSTAEAAAPPTKRPAKSRDGPTGANPKAYKSRFINLIRRISDKSEVVASSKDSSMGSTALTGGGSKSLASAGCGGGGDCGAVGGQRESGRSCRVSDTVAPGEMKAINQSGLGVSYSNQQRGDRVGQRLSAAEGSKHSFQAMDLGRGGRRMSCFSESLCDLNFDCDLELIKNCGSASKKSATESELALTGPMGSPLLTATTNNLATATATATTTVAAAAVATTTTGSFCNVSASSNAGRTGDANGNKEQQQQQLRNNKTSHLALGKWHHPHHHQHQKQPAIDTSKGENNWQLARAASTTLVIANNNNNNHHNHNNGNPTMATSSIANSQPPSSTKMGAEVDRNHHYAGRTGDSNIITNQYSNHRLNLMKPKQSKGSIDLEGKIGFVNTRRTDGASADIATTSKQTNNIAAAAAGGDKSAPIQSGKLKWSASAWFLNSGNSAKKNKLQQKQQQQQQQAPTTNEKEAQPGKKKYLDRLMSSSGTPGKGQLKPVSSGGQESAAAAKLSVQSPPQAGGHCSIQAGRFGQQQQQQQQQQQTTTDNIGVMGTSEADQLLDELDQSLALVSNAGQYGHFTPAKCWWQGGGHPDEQASVVQDDIRMGVLLSDSDESDDADYASINQAMINETFDVDLSKDNGGVGIAGYYLKEEQQLSVEPGSPSDSFTFSAPDSGTPSPRARFDCNIDSSPTGQQKPASTGAKAGDRFGLQNYEGKSTSSLYNNVDNDSRPDADIEQAKTKELLNHHNNNNNNNNDNCRHLALGEQSKQQQLQLQLQLQSDKSAAGERVKIAKMQEATTNGRHIVGHSFGLGCRPNVSQDEGSASSVGKDLVLEAAASEDDGKSTKQVAHGSNVNSRTFTKNGSRFHADVSGRIPPPNNCANNIGAQEQQQPQQQASNGCQAKLEAHTSGKMTNGDYPGICYDAEPVSGSDAMKTSGITNKGNGMINLDVKSDCKSCCSHDNDVDDDDLNTTRHSSGCNNNNNNNNNNKNNQAQVPSGSSQSNQTTDNVAGAGEHYRLHLNHFHVDGKRIETGASCNKCALAKACPGPLLQDQCRPASATSAKVNSVSTGAAAAAGVRAARGKELPDDYVADRFRRHEDAAESNSKYHPIQGQSTCCANCCGGARNDSRQQSQEQQQQQQQQQQQAAYRCDDNLPRKLTPSPACTLAQNDDRPTPGSCCSGRHLANMEVDASKFEPVDCRFAEAKRPQQAGDKAAAAPAAGCCSCRHCDQAKKEIPRCCCQSGDTNNDDLDDNGSCMDCTGAGANKEDNRAVCNGLGCQCKGDCNNQEHRNHAAAASGRRDNKLIIRNGSGCHHCASSRPKASPATSAIKTTGAGKSQMESVSGVESSKVASKGCKGNDATASGTGSNSSPSSSPNNNNNNNNTKVGSSVVTYYHYSHEMGKFALTNGQDVVMDRASRPVAKSLASTRDSRPFGNKCPSGSVVNNGICERLKNRKTDDTHRADEPPLYNSDNELIREANSNDANEFQLTKAASCHPHLHHPSSQLHNGADKNNRCNEDVKVASFGSSRLQQTCVSGDNLMMMMMIGKPDLGRRRPSPPSAHRLDNPKILTKCLAGKCTKHQENESSSRMSPSTTKADVFPSNTSCCSSSANMASSSVQHHDCHCCSSTETTTTAAAHHQHYNHEDDNDELVVKRQAAHQAANRFKPICRSNSELATAMISPAGKPDDISKQKPLVQIQAMAAGGHQRTKDGPVPLFGKLRSSLLNHKQTKQQPLSDCSPSKLLASSQISLVNYYSSRNCAGTGGKAHLTANLMAPIKSLDIPSQPTRDSNGYNNNNNNNLDDNFILKRKTPNAGLKSRC